MSDKTERPTWRTRIANALGLSGVEVGARAEAHPPQEITEEEQSPAPLDDDSPISDAAQDRFGVDAFAGIVARALVAQRGASGTVVALNGPWGSGKSSAVNLVVDHLAQLSGDAIEVIPFNPWWFSGTDQLARAFLDEVATKIGRSVAKDGIDALAGIRSRLSKLDTYVEAARRAGDDGLGTGIATLLFEPRSVEDDHARLVAALQLAKKQFVVVIDDIDRLNPDEALQMFQLVKSVGRLPYISYLLAFDRLLIERLLEERYPSEGGRYLEKVLQATFDLPDPSRQVLRQMALEAINRLVDVPDAKIVEFMNLFEDVVVPRLTTPRQLIRFLGSLRVSWPAIEHDVDPGDFMAIEAVRVFEPALYRAIRNHGDLVLGKDDGDRESGDAFGQRCDAALLGSLHDDWKEWAKTGLQRLFPTLERGWGGVHYGSDFQRGWDVDRRICSKPHFPTYFSYAVPPETLSGAERQALLDATADASTLTSLLRDALSEPRGDGGTRASLMLDALSILGDRIPIENVPTLVAGLFAVADDLAVDADAKRGFAIANNPLRIHWIMNNQVRERFAFEARAELIESALAMSPIGWRVDFADRMARDYEPPAEGEKRESTPFVEEATARRLRADAEDALLVAAINGSLLASPRAIQLLWRLRNIDAGKEHARRLTDELLATDAGVVRLADMVTSTSWSQGMGFAGLGDRVARASPRVYRDSLSDIVDADRLHSRAAELAARDDLAPADKRKLNWFLKGWDRSDDDRD